MAEQQDQAALRVNSRSDALARKGQVKDPVTDGQRDAVYGEYDAAYAAWMAEKSNGANGPSRARGLVGRG